MAGATPLAWRLLAHANLVSKMPLQAPDPGNLAALTAALAALAVGALSWLDNEGEQAATAALTGAMAHLRASEANLASLIENTYDLVFLLDAQGNLLATNSVARESRSTPGCRACRRR